MANIIGVVGKQSLNKYTADHIVDTISSNQIKTVQWSEINTYTSNSIFGADFAPVQLPIVTVATEAYDTTDFEIIPGIPNDSIPRSSSGPPGGGNDVEIHRLTDPNTAGGRVTHTVRQSTVFANDLLVSVNGSCVTGHFPFVIPHVPTCTPKTANGSQRVFAEDIPVNRRGDADTCGHPRAAGSPNVYVYAG